MRKILEIARLMLEQMIFRPINHRAKFFLLGNITKREVKEGVNIGTGMGPIVGMRKGESNPTYRKIWPEEGKPSDG